MHARLWDESGFLVQFNVDATPLNIMGHAPTLAYYGNLGSKTSGSHELPQCMIIIIITYEINLRKTNTSRRPDLILEDKESKKI